MKSQSILKEKVNNWEEAKLGDLIDVKHGYAFKSKYFRDQPPGNVLLTPGNFEIGGSFKGDKFKYYFGETPKGYTLHKGDLLITMTDLSKAGDTLGYPAIIPEAKNGFFLHNQRLGKVIIKDESRIRKDFLYYLLRSSSYRHEVLASATGSTVKHTSPTRIKEIMFLLPPLPVQKAIAGILGALDDKIELNRQINKTLEQMAQAIFKSWFIDFDPVKVKAQGKKPFGMDAATAALFPDSFKDSPLGKIPKGWDVTTIEMVASKDKNAIVDGPFGTQMKVAEYVDRGIPIVEMDYLEGVPFYKPFKHFITEEKYESVKRSTVLPGDIIISKTGTLGLLGLMTSIYGKAVIVSRLAKITPDTQKTNKHYLFQALKKLNKQKYWDRMSSGSTMPLINLGHIKATKLVLPPIKLQNIFGDMVRGLINKIHINLIEGQTLSKIRNELLPKLLSGEMRIKT